MENSKGLVTIPTDLDVVPETLELMKRWGADAIRDCVIVMLPTLILYICVQKRLTEGMTLGGLKG